MKITDLKIGKMVKIKASGIVGKIYCYLVTPVSKIEKGKIITETDIVVYISNETNKMVACTFGDLECVEDEYEIHIVDKIARDKIYKLMGLEKNKPFYLTWGKDIIKRETYIIDDNGKLVYDDNEKCPNNIGLGQLLSGLAGYCYVNAAEKGQNNKLTDSKI